MTSAVILFVLMGFLAGFVSACLNFFFGGKRRLSVIILVGVLLPGSRAVLTVVMNVLWFIVGSPQFIHFSIVE